MKMKLEGNNQAIAQGTVGDVAPVFSHEVFGKAYYKTVLQVPRFSGIMDKIPCMVSEQDLKYIVKGEMIKVAGYFQSYNKPQDGKTKLLLYLFVKEVDTTVKENCWADNVIILDGFLCKKPTYRVTPLGKEITDFILAVNRPGLSASDYIPCICWRENARFMADMSVGTPIKLEGRMQSREYSKNEQLWTAYEVSANQIRTGYK